MNTAPAHYSPPVQLLAQSLLDVWLTSSQREMRTTLKEIAQLSVPQEHSGDFERADLLKCVASRIKKSRGFLVLSAESSEKKLCVDLLRHLAVKPAYAPEGSGLAVSI